MRDKAWTDDDVPDQSGKRFLVTGANTGLGLETARALVRKKGEVVLLCRDRERGEAALASLPPSSGKAPSLELLDLGSLDSVRAFAEKEVAAPFAIDGLVCNAGVMAIPERKTPEGFEMQMGVNHLGHFALVGRLFSKLHTARVVLVSSHYHKKGKLELLDDLSFTRRRYDRWNAYQQSKLANLLMMFELGRRARRHGHATVATGAHPGYANTELQSRGMQQGSPRWEGWGMAIGNALIAQPVRDGAWPQLRALTDPAARSGDYFGPGGFQELRGPAMLAETSSRARDEAAAAKLWALSEELTGVRFLD